jgi:hypothetical protein
MHAENNPETSNQVRRPGRHVWYFAAMGLIAGAAIVAPVVLPQEIAGVTLVALALLVGIVDRVARRCGAAPAPAKFSAGIISYYVLLALVLIGSLVVVWAVVRNSDAIWLAWILAGVQFVVALTGAWVVDGRVTHETKPASA